MKMMAFVAMMMCVGATVWAEDKVLANDAAAGDRFGVSVSVAGNYVLIGAPYNADNGTSSGSAYIFEKQGVSWVQVAQLYASDAAATYLFGQSVGMSGEVAIVGAPFNADNGTFSGTAYIFEKQGVSWVQVAHLYASDAAAFDQFGRSVSVSGNNAIIGAPLNDENGSASGSVYIFEKQGVSWAQVAVLYASDADQDDRFGSIVAINGDYAIVGSTGNADNGTNSGSAYIFEKQGVNWVQVAHLIATDAAANDLFGRSVAISANVAIVGATANDDNGTNSGSVYIFEKQGVNWVQTAQLYASDAAAFDNFGASVGMSGSYVIVGAEQNSDNGSQSGSAYIFEKQGGAWVEVAQLYAYDAAAMDTFGFTVSASGNHFVVAAPENDDNGTNSGSAYIFTRCVSNQVLAQGQCVDCGAGEVPNSEQSTCVACGVGEVTNGDKSACVACGQNAVPNTDKSACVACGEGEEPNSDQSACVASADSASPQLEMLYN